MPQLHPPQNISNQKLVRRSLLDLRSLGEVGGEAGSTFIIHQSNCFPTFLPSDLRVALRLERSGRENEFCSLQAAKQRRSASEAVARKE